MVYEHQEVTVEADVRRVTDAAVDRFGRLDVLFNNAGGPTAGGGSITNNSSIAALRHLQGNILYSAVKAAITHYSKLAGVELGRQGIRVNVISPRAIATPIFWGGSARANTLPDAENARKMAKLQGNLAKANPLKKSGLARDIATAALFLASNEGRSWRPDLNRRPPHPQCDALPDCATPRDGGWCCKQLAHRGTFGQPLGVDRVDSSGSGRATWVAGSRRSCPCYYPAAITL